MKIKGDFVTNSSSTAFFFTFKGDIESLFKCIKKHKKDFCLTYDTEWDKMHYEVNHMDIINSILDVIDNNEKMVPDKYKKQLIYPITEAIAELKKDTEYLESLQEKQYLSHYYKEHKEHLRRLILAKKNGAEKCLIMNFGDHDGDVCGGPIGHTMDYEGREIDICDGVFQVFTRQDR